MSYFGTNNANYLFSGISKHTKTSTASETREEEMLLVAAGLDPLYSYC